MNFRLLLHYQYSHKAVYQLRWCSLKTGRRRGAKLGKWLENCVKIKFFAIFWGFLIYARNFSQDRLWYSEGAQNITSECPGIWSNFLILAPFSHLSLPTTGPSYLNENLKVFLPKKLVVLDQNEQKVLVHWPVVKVTIQKVFHPFYLFWNF